jgi:hypothetical protein
MELKDLSPQLKNPRKISDQKLTQLKISLDKFGELNCFVFNKRSQKLISGHQRQKIMTEGKITIVDVINPPTNSGTIAEGYIEYGEERFKYREVDVDENTEKAMTIAANKHSGEWDMSILPELLLDLDSRNWPMENLGFSEMELQNILAPVDQPKDEIDKDKSPKLCPNCGEPLSGKT